MLWRLRLLIRIHLMHGEHWEPRGGRAIVGDQFHRVSIGQDGPTNISHECLPRTQFWNPKVPVGETSRSLAEGALLGAMYALVLPLFVLV